LQRLLGREVCSEMNLYETDCGKQPVILTQNSKQPNCDVVGDWQ